MSPSLARKLATAASALLLTSAFAQNLSNADKGFMEQAAQNGHAEVEAGKLAQKQGSSQEVKTFAKQMVADHTKAGKELEALAKSKGIAVPREPSIVQKGQLELLGTKEGAEFDKSYAEQMGVKAHQDTVELFEEGARQAKDPQVKAYAAKTLPTLESHLDMAKKLASSTGAKQQ